MAVELVMNWCTIFSSSVVVKKIVHVRTVSTPEAEVLHYSIAETIVLNSKLKTIHTKQHTMNYTSLNLESVFNFQ